jgi:hypothetical protein
VKFLEGDLNSISGGKLTELTLLYSFFFFLFFNPRRRADATLGRGRRKNLPP